MKHRGKASRSETLRCAPYSQPRMHDLALARKRSIPAGIRGFEYRDTLLVHRRTVGGACGTRTSVPYQAMQCYSKYTVAP